MKKEVKKPNLLKFEKKKIVNIRAIKGGNDENTSEGIGRTRNQLN